MTSSGSTALLLAILALDISSGDEVLVPNYTWIATAHAPALVGASVIPVDTRTDFPILSESDISKLIHPKLKQ